MAAEEEALAPESLGEIVKELLGAQSAPTHIAANSEPAAPLSRAYVQLNQGRGHFQQLFWKEFQSVGCRL
jgi:hypothetical protein